MFKYNSSENQNCGIEPYTINRTDQTSSSPTSIPKYLEIIYDERDDVPTSSPYEIPLTGPIEEHVNNATDVQNIHDRLQTSLNLSNLKLENSQNNNNTNKERTFSSSSTVSETSVCYPPYAIKLPQSQTSTSQIKDNSIASYADAEIGSNQLDILTAALPNSSDDCNSEDNLLTEDFYRPSDDLKNNKIRQFYSIAQTIDDLSSNCEDGITLM